MVQPSKEYRKTFREYQMLMEQDSCRAGFEECENHLVSLKSEKTKLEQQITELQQKLNDAELEQKEQQETLHQMEKDMEQMRSRQQILLEEEFRKAGLTEKAAQWVEDENARSSREILQNLDAQLEKIEKIIAGYITIQKNYMDSIAEIIDDPGR